MKEIKTEPFIISKETNKSNTMKKSVISFLSDFWLPLLCWVAILFLGSSAIYVASTRPANPEATVVHRLPVSEVTSHASRMTSQGYKVVAISGPDSENHVIVLLEKIK